MWNVSADLPYLPPHISPGPFRQTRFPHLSTVHPYMQLVAARGTSRRPSEQAGGSGELWPPLGSHTTAKRTATAAAVTVLISVVVVAPIFGDDADPAAVAWRDDPAGCGGQQMGAGVASTAVAMVMTATAVGGFFGSAATGRGTRGVGTLSLRARGETVHSRDGPSRYDITAYPSLQLAPWEVCLKWEAWLPDTWVSSGEGGVDRRCEAF